MGRLANSIIYGALFVSLALALIFAVEQHENLDPVVSETSHKSTPKDWKLDMPDGPGIMAVADDSSTSQEVMAIHRNGTQLIDIVFFGKDGMPAVKLRADGTVDVLQPIDDATRAFWEAVASSMPLCKELP